MKKEIKITLSKIAFWIGLILFIEGFFDLTFETSLGFIPINSIVGIIFMGIAYMNIQIIKLKHLYNIN